MEMFREITRTDEVSGIKHIGEHSLRVITVFILCILYFKNIYMGFALLQQSNLVFPWIYSVYDSALYEKAVYKDLSRENMNISNQHSIRNF